MEKEVDFLKNNVIIDDRTTFTIGRRLLDARRVGYRYIIVINDKSLENSPLYEFNDTMKNCKIFLTENQIIQYIKENTTFHNCINNEF